MQIGNFVKMIENAIITNWDEKSMSLYKGEGKTYKEVGQAILQFHTIFKQAGINKGDKISLIGLNDYHWGIAYLSVITYGAVIVPILQDFHPQDIAHIIEHSDSVLLIGTDSIIGKLDVTKFDKLLGIILLDDFSGKNLQSNKIEDIVKDNISNTVSSEKEEFKLPKISNDDLAVISYTSGTSGFSKGVMLPHLSLASNVQFGIDYIGLKPGDNIVSFLPLAHAFACSFEFLTTFIMGCNITFLGKVPSPTVILQAFKEIKPRLIFSVPLIIEKIFRLRIKPKIETGIAKTLIKIPLLNKIVYNKVRKQLNEAFGDNFMEVIIGGAALNPEVESFLKKSKFRFTVGYGMTECGPLISYSNWKVARKHSCGKAIDCIEVKIDSPDPRNIVGEILVKGSNVMDGYYKNPEITASTIDSDGWLHTGDLGIIDNNEYVFIKGRSKNMILSSSGQNIYPEEIESKINNLPFVLESIVVECEGKLQALIVPDKDACQNHGITEERLDYIMTQNHQHINAHLPSFMLVSKFIIHDGEFEKTAKKSIKRFKYKPIEN
ncbi:MAG: AMP-binding protein [Salinivirgaceae bacterium]|nr:AMP-binding protein [Salinivirgaceae bacterium]